MPKYPQKLFILAAFLLKTAELGALTVHNVDIPDDSLTAQYFVPAVQSAMNAVQGSYAARMQAKKMELTKERDSKFPDGTPHKDMCALAEDVLEGAEDIRPFDAHRASYSNWKNCEKEIEKFTAAHETMLEMPAKLIRFALEVEEKPGDFAFPPKENLEQSIKEGGSDFLLSVVNASREISYKEHDFFRQHARAFYCNGIEDLATPHKEKAISLAQELLGAFLPEERLKDGLDKAFSHILDEKYSFDDFFNGWFVTTRFLMPMLNSLSTIREESLKKKDATS